MVEFLIEERQGIIDQHHPTHFFLTLRVVRLVLCLLFRPFRVGLVIAALTLVKELFLFEGR